MTVARTLEVDEEVVAVGTRERVIDLGLRTMNLAHRSVMIASGGRIGRTLGSMPVVELHTTGRRTGAPRSTLLTVPVRDGDRYVLVASKGGDDRDPAWYLNLLATPKIELTVDGRRLPMHARPATASEREALWPQITSSYRGYAAYQRRTDREIPVVICEPRPNQPSGDRSVESPT